MRKIVILIVLSLLAYGCQTKLTPKQQKAYDDKMIVKFERLCKSFGYKYKSRAFVACVRQQIHTHNKEAKQESQQRRAAFFSAMEESNRNTQKAFRPKPTYNCYKTSFGYKCY